MKPGEKPPLYPRAARVKSKDGANAFAEFFLKTIDWGYATTSPAYMKHYYAAGCGLCDGWARAMVSVQRDRRFYLGGRLIVEQSVGVARGDVLAPMNFCTSLRVSVAASTVVDSTGKIYDASAAESSTTVKFCQLWQGSSWTMTYAK